MPISPEQRQRILDNISSGRLRLDTPSKMYAGNGEGKPCAGCTEIIERTQLEWEAVYENGRAYHLHLGCAGLWDVERRRRDPRRSMNDLEGERPRGRNRADILAREAEAVIEESRRVNRSEAPPGK